MRFYRNYLLEIIANNTLYEIRPPLRLQFSAEKGAAGFGLNNLKAKVFGLAKEKRDILTKDVEQSKVVSVRLSIGYGENIKKIFSGQLHRGSNQLTSNGYVSDIECLDGGVDYFNSITSKTVRGKNAAIDAVISDMPNTSRGKTTQFRQLTRPKVLIGPSSKLLEDMTGKDEQLFIDNGRVYITKLNEVVSRFIPVVNEASGLISTPSKESQKITFSTVLNPYIVVAGRVNLESKVEERFNGIYRVEAISYKGDTEGADWKQDVTALPTQGIVVL